MAASIITFTFAEEMLRTNNTLIAIKTAKNNNEIRIYPIKNTIMAELIEIMVNIIKRAETVFEL